MDRVPPVERLLISAVVALRSGQRERMEKLNESPVPVYATDASGLVTYFNRACVAFAGREPQIGKDRWCVTWKLYTADGTYMPPDACPMAVTLKTGHPVRGIPAIAERPDGSRIEFTPFPTPFFDEAGALLGAINAFGVSRFYERRPRPDRTISHHN